MNEDTGLAFYFDFFKKRSEVLEDIKQCGTWPTTFVSGDSDGLDAHWHDYDVNVYIMEGETDFYDEKTQHRTRVKTGDKILVPAGAIHAEGAVKGRVVYLIAIDSPVSGPEFLAMRTTAE